MLRLHLMLAASTWCLFACLTPDAQTGPCAGQTCSDHGTCIVADGGAQCVCAGDYAPMGLSCVKKDACGADGTACNDHDECTTGETCMNGVCGNGTAVQCEARSCKAASCKPDRGCVYTNTEDGESCDGGACQIGICIDTEVPRWPVGDPDGGAYLVDAPGGTVIDTRSHLQWQIDVGTNLTLDQALEYCAISTKSNYTDWRLPGRAELLSIVDYSVNRPALRAEGSFNGDQANAWTTQPVVPETGAVTQQWVVNFLRGATQRIERTAMGTARCVRFTRPETNLATRFTVDQNVITDNGTGLEWYGVPFSARLLELAPDACDTAASGGNWRMPSALELLSLTDPRKSTPPLIDTSVFAGTQAINFWTTSVYDSNSPWMVNFGTGVSSLASGPFQCAVRCVRSK